MANLNDWLNKPVDSTETISAWPSQALMQTFNFSRTVPTVGDNLPPLWHWLHFLTADNHAQLGQDGHAVKGGFLPPVDLPRRMWARGRMTWHQPLVIGERYQKTSRVQAITPKQGCSGPLVFVEVRHQFTDGAQRLVAEEIHDIVYRDGASAKPAMAATEQKPAGALFEVDAVQLFRYSALTFNSHRIHYDADYARDVEGYPGMIVHGPLIATFAMEALAQAEPSFQPRTLDFKMLSPVFLVGEKTGLTACVMPSDDGFELSVHHQGERCLTAVVR